MSEPALPSRQSKSVWMPDESGMGGEFVPLDVPHWDPDCGRWMVQLNHFIARPASDEELREHGIGI